MCIVSAYLGIWPYALKEAEGHEMRKRDDREREMSYALKEAAGDMTCLLKEAEGDMTCLLKEAEGDMMTCLPPTRTRCRIA